MTEAVLMASLLLAVVPPLQIRLILFQPSRHRLRRYRLSSSMIVVRAAAVAAGMRLMVFGGAAVLSGSGDEAVGRSFFLILELFWLRFEWLPCRLKWEPVCYPLSCSS